MNLDLNEDQKLLQRTMREFAENEVKPLAREIDETCKFPRETFRKAADLGRSLSARSAGTCALFGSISCRCLDDEAIDKMA